MKRERHRSGYSQKVVTEVLWGGHGTLQGVHPKLSNGEI